VDQYVRDTLAANPALLGALLGATIVDTDGGKSGAGGGKGGNAGGKAPGVVKILPGATPDANELRAGQGLADQFGYDVVHQPTASQLGVQGQRTADLTVKGVGQVDVYTPSSTNPTSITRAIEGKNTQANAVLVQTSISDADMATVASRTWGKPTAQNIQTIFFQKPDGTIVRFNRPTGG
jgi:filamentous hemagglutinin